MQKMSAYVKSYDDEIKWINNILIFVLVLYFYWVAGECFILGCAKVYTSHNLRMPKAFGLKFFFADNLNRNATYKAKKTSTYTCHNMIKYSKKVERSVHIFELHVLGMCVYCKHGKVI